MTIFLSSHILSAVHTLCKRVAIIKEGKIIQIEDIDSMRKKQLKKVTIEFSEPVNIEDFDFLITEKLNTGQENVLSFLYSGNINELVVFLTGKRLNNLMIEEPSLDEIFLHYYRI